MGALSGRYAAIQYTAASPTSSTDQAATLSGLYVTINNTARRRWDPTVSISEYACCKNGTPISAASWTPEYGAGRFRFTSDPGAGTYTVDVPWLAQSYLGSCKSWSLSADVDMHDVTAMSTAGAAVAGRTFLPGLTDATVTLSRFIVGGGTGGESTGPLMIDRALLNLPFYLDLIGASTQGDSITCWGYLQGVNPSENVGEVAMEEVTLKVSGAIYYSTK